MISICIPAYNEPLLLKRCLDSIFSQHFQDFEIIISDDSTTTDISTLINEEYWHITCLKYYKNKPSMGSPKNWNAVMDQATGDYFILMHQDDFFADPNALSCFVSQLDLNPALFAVYGKSTLIDPSGKTFSPDLPEFDFHKKPFLLQTENCIGVPSNIAMRRTRERYDPFFKWLVDIEFYMRLIAKGARFQKINKTLVYTSVHPAQISSTYHLSPQKKLIENLMFCSYAPFALGKNIRYYDHFWRLLRNTGAVDPELVNVLDYYPFVYFIYQYQLKINPKWLTYGFISKGFMFLSFLKYFFTNKFHFYERKAG